MRVFSLPFGDAKRRKTLLGPQCWTCRVRRAHCDSQRPVCSNCQRKGLDCLGYSSERPLQSQPIRVPLKQLALLSIYTRDDDIVPAHTALETLLYYNRTVGRDFGAFETQEMITASEWLTMCDASRHLFMCIVKFHQLVQVLPANFHGLESLEWGSLDRRTREQVALLSQHQAQGARLVREKIQAIGSMQLDPELFFQLVCLLECQIQQGSSGIRKTHLQAAKTLLSNRGSSVHQVIDDCDHYIIVNIDIFQTTTTASRELSDQTCKQQFDYIAALENLSIDNVFYSPAPIPTQLAIATALINICRSPRPPTHAYDSHGATPALILDRLQAFCPRTWAQSMMRPPDEPHEWICAQDYANMEPEESWVTLAQCFQCAVTLYLFLAGTSTVGAQVDTEVISQRRTEAYQNLIQAIKYIFDHKKDGSRSNRHHKFITWPLVIAGLEAVVIHHDLQQVEQISTWLRFLTFELGTLTMRKAARFLDQLSAEYIIKDRDYEYRGSEDWDKMFHDGVLYLY